MKSKSQSLLTALGGKTKWVEPLPLKRRRGAFRPSGVLMLILFLFLSHFQAQAYDWETDLFANANNIDNTTYDKDTGRINFKVLIADTGGSKQPNLYIYGMTITVDGVKILSDLKIMDTSINKTDQGAKSFTVSSDYASSVFIQPDGAVYSSTVSSVTAWRSVSSTYSYYFLYPDESNRYYWLPIYYLPSYRFAYNENEKKIDVKFSDIKGIDEDQKTGTAKAKDAKSLSITRPFTISSFTAKINSQGQYEFSGATDISVVNRIVAYNGSTIASMTDSGNTFSKTATINTTHCLNGGEFEYSARKDDKTNIYVYRKADIPMIAVFNGDLSISQSNEKIVLSWNVSRPNCTNNDSRLNTNGFVVYKKRTSESSWTQCGTVSYNHDKESYSYEYTIPEAERENDTVNYQFKVMRNAIPDATSSLFSITKSKDINTNYAYPSQPAFDKDTKRIYFKESQGLKPDGFSYQIAKKEKNGNETSISNYYTVNESSDSPYKSYAYYFDSGINPCVPTIYYLRAVFKGTILQTSTLEVLHNENTKTSVSSFTGSKGYFNDCVKLKWTIPPDSSDFTSFRITRTSLNNKAGSEKIVYEKKYDGQSETIEYTDMVSPGVYYRYDLQGIIICDKDTFPSITQTDYAFAQAFGRVTGKVTFTGTTTGVPDVDIIFENTSTSDNTGINRALDMGTTGYFSAPASYGNSVEKTFQLWVKLKNKKTAGGIHTILSTTDNNSKTYPTPVRMWVDENNRLNLEVLGEVKTFNTVLPVDEYFHLTQTILYEEDGEYNYYLNTYLNGELIGAENIVNPTSMSFSDINIGDENTDKHLDGFVDELRVWNRVLSGDEVKKNYNRYIPSNNDNLAAYYRFDEPEGVTDGCYDVSGTEVNDYFNENHGIIYNNAVRTTEDAPSAQNLALKAKTDDSGNYDSGLILPYRLSGSSYSMAPSLGVHQFSPSERSFTISSSANTFNNYDFVDNSYFTYSGKVIYEGGDYPVEGCSFYIDNVQQTDSNYEAIVTDSEGKFSLSVPVGTHTIKIYKQGHTFAKETITKNFQDDEKDSTVVRFEDTTRVRVVGRVIGGTVESQKALGFGESKNNVGPAEIILAGDKIANKFKPESENVIHFDTLRSNTVVYKDNTITIGTDESTGEFYADLYPENYTINSIYIDKDNLLTGTMQWDLRDKVTVLKETQAYLTRVWNDTIIPNPMYPHLFDVIERTDSILCNDTLSYAHRVQPTMTVVELDENNNLKMLKDGNNQVAYYGEPEFSYTNAGNPSASETVPLVVAEGGKALYSFVNKDDESLSYPVYSQNKLYQYQVSLAEIYKNYKTGVEDVVPVGDAEIRIKNEMGQQTAEQAFALDSLGQYTYQSLVYRPNTATGLSSIEFTYPCISSTCPYQKIEAIVIGGESTGTNFSTQGPDKVFFVLRDPPGNNSYAYWETESSLEYTSGYTIDQSASVGAMTMIQMGTSKHVLLLSGLGVMVGTSDEFEYKNDLGFGLYAVESYNKEGSKVTTITTKQRIETSSDPEYVGPDADVFVGASTNILYGLNNLIEIRDEETSADFDVSLFSTRDNKYQIGKSAGVSLGEAFNTTFHYTQRTIRDILIPEWKVFISDLLKTATPPGSSTLTTPYYYSLRDRSHPDFGKPNSNGMSDGDSYKIVYPASWGDNDKLAYTDSVKFFNQQISGWENTLRLNERAKVRAVQRDNFNYSFGDGVSIDYSVVKDTINTNMTSVGGGFIQKSEGNIGIEISGMGFQVSVNQEVNFLETKNTGSSEKASETIGFVLSTASSDNKITTDIYEGVTLEEVCETIEGIGIPICYYANTDSIAGGFIFRTRGGQTSCPYEGEYATEYYEPGTVLNTATMRNEVPLLRILSQSTVTGVPADGKAVYQIQLINNSESGVGRWYQLRVESSSNPDGAVISLDGKVLTEDGSPVFVPYGETGVIKTITLERGPQKYVYENVNLVMASECQYNNMNYVEDIFSGVQLSATFLQGCSDVLLAEPLEYWVMNTDNTTDGALPVKVNGFDQNFENLGWVDVQWKDSYSSVWNTLKRYYFNQVVMDGDKSISDENKELYDNSGQISCNWDMTNRVDGNYDVRAITACVDPNTYLPFIYTNTPARTGVKDMQRPEPFGRPEPKDGVLDIDDEIMIQFNEPVSSGRITDNNIHVTGVLSGGQGTKYHPAAIHLNGSSSVCSTPNDITLAAPFTIEAWVRLNESYYDSEEHVLFSHGADLVIGINNDLLFVRANDKTMYSEYIDVDPSDPEWGHLAVSYDSDGTVYGYFGKGASTDTFYKKLGAYNKTARLAIGNSITATNGINADIHDVRIWTTSRSSYDISSSMTSAYNGPETNLKHYWRFDEMEGTAATDLAGGLTSTLNGAVWTMPNPGKSVELASGSNLSFTGSNFGISNTNDFTIEMWFKGESQTNATLFSAGNGAANTDYNNTPAGYDSSDKLSIFFNGTGKLSLSSNARTYTINSVNYADNKWHHMALSVNRLGNASMYLDGNAVWNTAASNIGGMVAANYYIGQRGWYPTDDQTADNIQLDNPFRGQIDEVRIWKAALDAAHIREKRNVRLNGDEIGLVSYYPFENYETQDGSPVITTSLENFAPDEHAEAAVLTTNATLSNEYAPVKMEGPTRSLGYRKVVNGDKILITLTDSRYRLEKSLVTIAVDGIQDLNGNKQESAVIWTAFINQSQLRWAQSELALQGSPGTTIQQGVQINNTSGESKSFTIKDIPAWLEVSPTSGTISAQSSQTINIKVAPAVNAGQYEQTLLLNGPIMNTEPESIDQLTVKLNLKNDSPDWTVNPANYEYSSGVIATLLIDNVYSTDVNDMLAAFVGDECRGIANVSYESSYGRYVVYLTVYSDNFDADNFVYRIWDASASEVREATTTATFSWSENYSFGSVNAPIVFTATGAKLMEIDLLAGWSWISLNIKADNMSLNSLLGELTSKAEILKNQSAFSATTTGQWKGSLESIDNKQMYKLKMNQSSVLHLAGTPVSPEDEKITILPNWNWIAYTPQGSLSVKNALAGLQPAEGDIIKDQTSFSTYNSGNWVGSLVKMSPGKGYVYQSNATESKTFNYPYVSSSNTPGVQESPKAGGYFNPVPSNIYSDNMTIVAVVKDKGAILPGIELGAFIGEQCRGAQTTDAEGLIFITVAGEGNSGTIQFKAYDSSTGSVITALQTLAYASDEAIGTIVSPYVIELSGTGIDQIMATEISIYPNPVKDELSIARPWEKIDRLEVLTPEGRVLNIVNDFNKPSLNVSALSEGLYFLRITQNGQTLMIKFIKK